MKSLRKLTLALVLLVLSVSVNAGERASFGFATGAKTSGFFLNPTLEQVWISRIEPDSPAQKAGLLVDDVVISANGKPIAGAPAKNMVSLLRSLKPGDHLRLKVLRSDKEVLVEIVAGSQ